MRRWLAKRLARSIGMELHYPERPDPPGGEASPPARNDGTPCAREPRPAATIRRADR